MVPEAGESGRGNPEAGSGAGSGFVVTTNSVTLTDPVTATGPRAARLRTAACQRRLVITNRSMT